MTEELLIVTLLARAVISTDQTDPTSQLKTATNVARAAFVFELQYLPSTSSRNWFVSATPSPLHHIGSHVALWGDALIVPRAEVKPCLHVTRLLPHAFQSALTFLGSSQPTS